MTSFITPLRTILVLLILAVAAGCSSVPPAADPTPTNVPTPSAQPSDAPPEAPVETPAPSPKVVGTLTASDGAAEGQGLALADALDGDLSQPVLVRGTLFLDSDGKVYMADSVVDEAAPKFGDVRVAVANYPTDGPTWDMAHADDTGLKEANGIRFFADTAIYGTISQ